MIKYLGSKRKLLPRLRALFASLPETEHVLDLFSGTSRVGRELRAAGLRVTACDELRFAATLARCYVQAPREVEPRVKQVLAELAPLPPTPGYFTRTFCEEARFFQPKNGARVDAMRAHLDTLSLTPDERAVVLTALMEAADRVDSTTGVQMAYLKQWAPRAHNDLELRLPALVDGPAGEAVEGDAAEVAAATPADAAYLDPPYNQHSYLGNYHVWETLVRWDAPEAYGVARKRIDRKTRRCAFNSKRSIATAFAAVLDALDVTHVIVSFSDEGFLERAQLEQMLSRFGHVEVVAVDYARYVGAKIGIHDPRGKRVGEVSHTRNQEFIFVAGPDAATVRAAAAAAGD